MKDLRVMKNDELRDVAREYCIIGTWKMTKDQLIDCIIRNAELNGHTDKYFDSAPEEPQEAPELTEAAESNKLLNKTKEPTESAQEPSKPKSDNDWELTAKKQLSNTYNWLVGKRENAVTDGEMTKEEFTNWVETEALDEVYHEAITTMYYEDACGGQAPTEMRFAGKDFCYKYLKRLFKRDGYQKACQKHQDGSGDTSTTELNNYKAKSEKPTEEPRDASKPKLKKYAASVRDRKTKELKDIFGEAKSRYEFYLSIKDEYRVRFIVTPDKLEEAYEKYRVGHARNLMLKKEKYSHDKAEAEKMKMTVAEYRKWLREFAKTVK